PAWFLRAESAWWVSSARLLRMDAGRIRVRGRLLGLRMAAPRSDLRAGVHFAAISVGVVLSAGVCRRCRSNLHFAVCAQPVEPLLLWRLLRHPLRPARLHAVDRLSLGQRLGLTVL